MYILVLLIAGASFVLSAEDISEIDGEQSRKILGSSVVTSVSVIMDTGNGSKAVFTDAVGKPIPRPSSASELTSPIDLLNPDRYEFYTFDDNGDLIKRLMSLEEIQGIIATGDSDGYDFDSFTSLGYLPEKRVNDVVNNVQNVLKEEMETHKNPSDGKPMFDTPDVSDSWSMILPAVFGNSGEDIKPEKPITHVTPDTIMIEPNIQNPYLTSSSETNNALVISSKKPIEQTIATSPRSTTSLSTPRPTAFSKISSINPTIVSTPVHMSTTDKLLTLKPATTTEKIPPLTPITEVKNKPMINVEIYSNSKSTENPLNEPDIENTPIVEIKPTDLTKDIVKPSYGSRITTKKPLTPTSPSIFSVKPSLPVEIKASSTTVTKESSTKPTTSVTFIPLSMDSTSPITKIETSTTTKPIKTTSTLESLPQAPTLHDMPVLTVHTTVVPIITWRPKPSSTILTEPPAVTEVPISTWNTQLTTDVVQPQTLEGQEPQLDLPTLADLLHLNTNTEIKEAGHTTLTTTESIGSGDLTTFTIVSEEKNDETSTEYVTQESSQTKFSDRVHTTEKSDEDDLSTLSSEYIGTKNSILQITQAAQQVAETTTQLPLEQSMNTAQKMSATELLDQLLFTTNIYEINTELAEKTTEQQTFSNEDERFETSTREESKVSEIRTEIPTTTEEFLIKVSENTEQSTTDKSLINSIEQLLSQAVDNVEELLTSVNDTQRIQDVLINSGTKNMTEVQMESATLTSDMIGLNFERNEENESTTTTELNMLEALASDSSNVLSDSVGSLLSQVYEGNPPSITTIEQLITTEKYPTTVVKATPLSTRETDDVTLTMNAGSITDKYELETSTLDNSEKYTKFDSVFGEQKTATPVTIFEIENVTANEPTIVSYMPLDQQNEKNVSNENFVTHLINITIIGSENTNNIVKNRTKPAKADLSLEQMFDEEIKNYSSVLSESSTNYKDTEVYIDQTSTSTTNEKINIVKLPNVISKSEETTSAWINNTAVTEDTTDVTNHLTQNNQTETLPVSNGALDEITEISTEQTTLATTESFIPIKEISKIIERPTTIIIIKRTEKPPMTEATTISSIKESGPTNINIDTTTLLDEQNLDFTTYSQDGEKELELVTEKILPITTEISQDASNIEITEPEPSVEIIIGENIKNNNKEPLIENTVPIGNHSVQISAPFSNESSNKNNNENKAPQETSNVNVKISGELGNLKKVSADKFSHNKSSQIEKFNKSELSAEDKPESTWTLVPTIAPHSEEHIEQNYSPPIQQFPEIIEPPSPVDLVAKPLQGFGLEDSTSRLDADIYQFAQLCNELAFGFWKTVTNGISSARSVFVSPFGATSLLAMVFLGARGATSGEMNEILRLDDMVTFNPHLIFKNVSESIKTEEPESGVASSAIIRELFSDRSKGKLLPFYKERARAFYDGYVEEASFREIGDVIRRRTNLQVKKYTNGKMTEFLKDSLVTARSPLAGVSVNVFQTDCSQASTGGRDGELHFVVLPSIRQRRLIPVPAVVYKSGFLAGYEPSLDATAVSLGTKDQIVSTILVIPGQQGIAAPGDGLARLEKRLVESSFKKGAWSRLLRSLIPRPGLEVQIPRFSHKSIINATIALKKMGLHDLFDVEKADLRGLNGVANELFLSDMLQINSFATCGEKRIGDTHHSEIYPASTSRVRNARYLERYQSEDIYYRSDLLEEPRDYQRAFPDPLHDPNYLSLPLPLRPRQARVPEIPRLRFDRPFIYFVRHNPTGLILHMGRFNPRLLP